MARLSCSGTGCGIYAKLANGVAWHNGARDYTIPGNVLRGFRWHLYLIEIAEGRLCGNRGITSLAPRSRHGR